MTQSLRVAIFCGSAALALSAAATAQAQTTPQPASDQAADSTTDIIVTANKRSESTSRVGMSINAFTGDTLLKSGITDPSDLAKVVPAFNVSINENGSAPVYTIRGVGFDDNALGGAPTVSVYVDEVPLPYPALVSGAQLDVQRVEVLKGPQGVLFGNNTTGGAINYIAAGSTPTLTAGGTLEVNQYGGVDFNGHIAGPISDTLGYRLAFRVAEGGAFQRSQSRPGDKLGSADDIVGRLILDWKPTETMSFRLNVNGWRDRSDTLAPQAQEPVPSFAGLLPPAFAAAYKQNGGPDGVEHDSRAVDWDPNTDYRNNNRLLQVSLRGDINLADAVKLTSITSYTDFKRDSLFDNDGTYFQSTDGRQLGYIKSFYQEFRLAADLSTKLNILVGANYEHDRIRDLFYVLNHLSIYRAIYFGTNGFIGNPDGYGGAYFLAEPTVNTYAAFAKAEYSISNRLKILGAVRYTKDDRRARLCSSDSPGFDQLTRFQGLITYGNPNALVPGSCLTELSPNPATPSIGPSLQTLNQHNLSWRVGLNFQATPQTLLYATVNKGYKAGSFINTFAFSYLSYTPATQESLLSYEIGAKTRLLDGRLSLSGALFYYDYHDKQVLGRIVDPVGGRQAALVNIPRSNVRGGEIDATFRPVRELTLNVAAAYTRSKIESFQAADPYSNFLDIGGESFPNAPRFQINGGFEYRKEVSSRLAAYVGASAHHVSSTFGGGVGERPAFFIPQYTTVDARVGIAATDDKWSASLFARNLGNTYYYTAVQYAADSIQRYLGRPRTIGIQLGYQF